jgi:cytochrome c553
LDASEALKVVKKNLWVLISLTVLLTACDPNKIFGTRVTPPKEEPKTVEYQLFSPTVAIAGSAVAEAVKVVSAGEKKYVSCASCHGGDGEGGVGPNLQGQTVSYIKGRLTAYKNREKVGRQSVMMWSQASLLSDADINDLSDYISENF